MLNLESLNAAQNQAVTAETPNLLVLAGAGSGKTRVLVHRIAWLMQEQGVSPGSLLAVTFTNKAAREMRARIEALLGAAAPGIWLGTFHGLANRMLRAHAEAAGLVAEFQVIDSDDQQRLLKRCLRELQLDESRWPPRQAQQFINSEKDEGRRPGAATQEDDLWARTQQRIYARYQQLCESSGLVDFGELLLRCHELLANNPPLLTHYRERFRHLLVDEFQDTNGIQYAWLKLLSGGRVPITVVGDDDQSIYGWRGARIENIQRFQDDFQPAELVRLEQNYRSTGTILAAANAVIAANPQRLGKTLWTDRGEGEAISVYSAFNEMDEAHYVCAGIQQAHEQGDNLREHAILYRSNAQSRVFEETLLRAGLAYRVYGGLRFYDRQEIRNALAYLRLLRNRHDDAAFERVINVPARGIGPRTLERWRGLARQQGQSLWDAALASVNAGQVRGKAVASLQGFCRLIGELSAQAETSTLSELTRSMLDRSGLLDFHAGEKGEQGQARKENLLELVEAVAVYDREGDAPLADFLAQAALDAGEQQASEHQDCVQLMTLHSAKGLEFPTVYLVGVEEGLFPHALSAESPDRLQEERRLCYVGMTRAMRRLVITHAERRRLYGQEKYATPSRFLLDIPLHLRQEVRAAGASPVAGFAPAARAGEAGGLQLGVRVAHPKFGEGVVLALEGQGDHQRVQVQFQTAGAKWLIRSYARLEVLDTA